MLKMNSNSLLYNLGINRCKWQYLFVLLLSLPLIWTKKASSFDTNDLERLQQTNSCENCDLKEVNLAGANLEGANLQGANLENANMSDAKLSGAVLFKANLEDANLSGAELSVILKQLLGTMSIHCTDLREANLSGANLSHANLRIKIPVGSRWIVPGGTRLKTQDICNPALSQANFSRANLKDAELEGIELNQIVLCQTTMPDGSLSNANCPSDLKQ